MRFNDRLISDPITSINIFFEVKFSTFHFKDGTNPLFCQSVDAPANRKQNAPFLQVHEFNFFLFWFSTYLSRGINCLS